MKREIARRLRQLRVNRSAWSQLGDVGYFSLPGAQELKLAMKIGHHYELASISARDWDRVGATGGIRVAPRARAQDGGAVA